MKRPCWFSIFRPYTPGIKHKGLASWTAVCANVFSKAEAKGEMMRAPLSSVVTANGIGLILHFTILNVSSF